MYVVSWRQWLVGEDGRGMWCPIKVPVLRHFLVDTLEGLRRQGARRVWVRRATTREVLKAGLRPEQVWD